MSPRAVAFAALAFLASAATGLAAKELVKATTSSRAESSRPVRTVDARLTRDLAALSPQRPGHPDLFVLGVAGDGSERVFRNEVLHLQALASQRLDARGHALALANHDDEPGLPSLPLASVDNLARALAGIGRVMDRDEDVLLLYLTTHGTDDHRLLLRRERRRDVLLTPRQIRAALDASGIRHRVVVVSACYSGGFAKALRDPDTLVLMAARHDRSSFGCGNDSVATYFGRAWLVDGLNRDIDFVQAFERAKLDIRRREEAEDLRPSRPQIEQGARIGARLAAWHAATTPGPALPYPHAEDEAAGESTPPRPPANKSTSR